MAKFSYENLSTRNKVSIATQATYFVIVLLFLCMRLLSSFGLLDFMPSVVRSVVSTIFIQIILMFSLSLFMFSGLLKRKPKETLAFYGYKKMPAKSYVIALVLGVIVFFLNAYISTFIAQILEFLGFRSAAANSNVYPVWLLLLNILFTALLPAICEETAHRGMLLKGLLGFGATKAIIISGLLFGLMHMNINQFFYATLVGWYFGYIAIHSDCIIPGIIIHFVNNALSCFFTFASVNNLWVANFVNKVLSINGSNAAVGIIFNLAFVALLVVGLVSLTQKLIFSTSEYRVKDLQRHIYNDLVKQEYIDNVERSKQSITGVVDQNPQEGVINVENMFFDKNIELGYMTNLERDLIEHDQKFKPDVLSLALMVLSFAVGIGVTLFTFIWGIL